MCILDCELTVNSLVPTDFIGTVFQQFDVALYQPLPDDRLNPIDADGFHNYKRCRLLRRYGDKVVRNSSIEHLHCVLS